jgi:radical SAM superfamily enzyme YgiQ (UPF0313 family)
MLLSANQLAAPYPVYPLGLDYVAAAISERHTVRVLDMNALGTLGALGDALAAFAPDLVGISIRNIDNTDTTDPRGFTGQCQTLVDYLRGRTRAPIVLGGSGFTIFPDELMALLGADYGIVGEGERLADLLEALENGQPPEGIPGLVTARRRAALPAPLETAAGPRHVTPSGSAVSFYLARGGMLNLQTKRGCPFRCVYCTYPHIEGAAMRLIPAEQVAATAMALQASGARYLFITDSAFNGHVDHSLEVAAAFKRAGLSIPWGAFFAPTRLPSGYFEEMRSAGLTHVEFGTESLCDPVLKAYHKPFRVAQAVQAHRQAVAAGLHVAHYLLLGGPGETPATLEETLLNIDKLERTVVFFFCGMRIYPHTALYRLALENGQVQPGQDLLEPVFYQSPEIDAEAIMRRVRAGGREHANWVLGAGGDETEKVLRRLYRRGLSGPLWEFLIR